MQGSAILGDIDVLAVEQCLAVFLDAHVAGDISQRPQSVIVDEVLRQIDAQRADIVGHIRRAPRLISEELTKRGGAELCGMLFQSSPVSSIGY